MYQDRVGEGQLGWTEPIRAEVRNPLRVPS